MVILRVTPYRCEADGIAVICTSYCAELWFCLKFMVICPLRVETSSACSGGEISGFRTLTLYKMTNLGISWVKIQISDD